MVGSATVPAQRRLNANHEGRGLYSGEFFAGFAGLAPLLDIMNPINANAKILEVAEAFRKDFEQDQLGALMRFFEVMKVDGEYGIKFDLMEQRKYGYFTAEEVEESRLACCFEHALFFLSVMNQAGINADRTRAIGFTVYGDEEGNTISHACGGILLPGQVPNELKHKRFEMDAEFRKAVLSVAEVSDNEDLSLVLFDFTNRRAGAQNSFILPLSNETLMAAFLMGTGTRHTDIETGNRILKESWKMGDPTALHNLVLRLGSEEKWDEIIQITKDVGGPHTQTIMERRADALYEKLKKEETPDTKAWKELIIEMKIAGLKAVQASSDSWKGYYSIGVASSLLDDGQEAAKALANAHRILTEKIEYNNTATETTLQTVAKRDHVFDFLTDILNSMEKYDSISWLSERHLGTNALLLLNGFDIGRQESYEKMKIRIGRSEMWTFLTGRQRELIVKALGKTYPNTETQKKQTPTSSQAPWQATGEQRKLWQGDAERRHIIESASRIERAINATRNLAIAAAATVALAFVPPVRDWAVLQYKKVMEPSKAVSWIYEKKMERIGIDRKGAEILAKSAEGSQVFETVIDAAYIGDVVRLDETYARAKWMHDHKVLLGFESEMEEVREALGMHLRKLGQNKDAVRRGKISEAVYQERRKELADIFKSVANGATRAEAYERLEW